jgi:sensor domain CHASE-containing protein
MFNSLKMKILVLYLGLILSVAVALGITSYLIMFRSSMTYQQEYMESVATHLSTELSSLIACLK